MNVDGMPASNILSRSFSPNCIVGFADVKQCQDGALQWPLLETIFSCLDDLSDLIFAAPTFTKSSLGSGEQIFFLSDIVKTVS